MSVNTQCTLDCKNYYFGGCCRAFPGGIPAQIIFGCKNHRKPFPGDFGIMFEPMEPSENTATTSVQEETNRE